MGQPTKAPGMLGGTAIRPVERHGMEAVRYFFHNPDTGEIMTRTPMSWLLITIFYVIYYSCLGNYKYIYLYLMSSHINIGKPGNVYQLNRKRRLGQNINYKKDNYYAY